MHHTPFSSALIAALLSCGSGEALACATCGCSMSSDAATGYSATPGWRLSLEYNYVDQNQLRTGTKAVSTAEVAAINDAGGDQEVEKRTINRYTTLGIGYRPNADWEFSIAIPYVSRSHTTYGSATTDALTPDNVSSAESNGLGDVKLIAAWQGLLPTHSLGVQFGVKLPTGHYGGQNVDTGETVGRNPVFFSGGPNAGTALDTSLNPGTGSTDLIVGGYYFQPVSQDFDAFINGQFQGAVAQRLDSPGADFRPGNQFYLNTGVRYEAHPDWTPQVQLNLVHKTADQGALADTANTAGTALFLSPGISAAFGKAQFYAVVQIPVYSRLSGYQLFPRWTGSLGVSYSL